MDRYFFVYDIFAPLVYGDKTRAKPSALHGPTVHTKHELGRNKAILMAVGIVYLWGFLCIFSIVLVIARHRIIRDASKCKCEPERTNQQNRNRAANIHGPPHQTQTKLQENIVILRCNVLVMKCVPNCLCRHSDDGRLVTRLFSVSDKQMGCELSLARPCIYSPTLGVTPSSSNLVVVIILIFHTHFLSIVLILTFILFADRNSNPEQKRRRRRHQCSGNITVIRKYRSGIYTRRKQLPSQTLSSKG